MTNETQPYIFISYSHKDSEIVLRAIDALTSNGFSVWYDNGIEAGTEWPEYIAERMINCEVVIAFMSRNAQESNNCRQEIHFALELKKDLLVVYLEDFMLSPGMRLRLSTLQAMARSKFKEDAEFLAHLCNANILRPCKKAEEEKPQEIVLNNEALHNEYQHNVSLDIEKEAVVTAKKWEQPVAEKAEVFVPVTQKPAPDIKAEESSEKTVPETAPKAEKPKEKTSVPAKKADVELPVISAVNALNESRGNSPIRFKFVKDLTPEQLKNAVRVMSKNRISQSDIIAVFDDTIFDSAKSGYVVTQSHLFGAGALLDTFELPLEEIVSFTVNGSNICFGFADGTQKSVFFNNFCSCFVSFFEVYLKERDEFKNGDVHKATDINTGASADKVKPEPADKKISREVMVEAIEVFNEARGKNAYDCFKFTKDLTPKQMGNAVRVMAKNAATQGDIIAMIDDSILSNGKSGYLLTKNYLYGAGTFLDSFSLPLNDIVEFSVIKTNHISFTFADGVKKEVFFNNFAPCFEKFFNVLLKGK